MQLRRCTCIHISGDTPGRHPQFLAESKKADAIAAAARAATDDMKKKRFAGALAPSDRLRQKRLPVCGIDRPNNSGRIFNVRFCNGK